MHSRDNRSGLAKHISHPATARDRPHTIRSRQLRLGFGNLLSREVRRTSVEDCIFELERTRSAFRDRDNKCSLSERARYRRRGSTCADFRRYQLLAV